MKALFFPLVLLFKLFSAFHRRLYVWGFRKVVKLNKPVISVGNLTVGGTGKTPFIEFLLSTFESKNLKVCVLTRGYGRKSSETCFVGADSTSDQVGDEALWLYQKHPTAQILVSDERAVAAQKVTDVDVFILDDGLQHYGLNRDFDIVILDATRPLWHYDILPQGYAREGWGALKRADLVVISRANLVSEAWIDELADRIFKVGLVEVVESAIHLAGFTDPQTNEDVNLDGKKVFLASAIGNPESFEQLVRENKIQVVGHEKFKDHDHFSVEKIEKVFEKAKELQADMVLITEKDSVKWHELFTKNPALKIHKVAVAKARLTFTPDLEDIYDLVYHSFR